MTRFVLPLLLGVTAAPPVDCGFLTRPRLECRRLTLPAVEQAALAGVACGFLDEVAGDLCRARPVGRIVGALVAINGRRALVTILGLRGSREVAVSEVLTLGADATVLARRAAARLRAELARSP